MHGGLGDEMADGDKQRYAGVFPRIGPLPVQDDQSLKHGHDQKQRQKDQRQAVSASADQIVEAEIKLHPPLPLNDGVISPYNRRVKERRRGYSDSRARGALRANTLSHHRSCQSSPVATASSALVSHD